MKALKGAVAAKGPKKAAGRRKSRGKDGAAIQEAAAASVAATAAANAEKAASWGPLEPVYRVLSPVIDMITPLLTSHALLVIIGALLLTIVLRGGRAPTRSDVNCTGYTTPQRLAAYDELWHREESELWNWLEDRVGMDGMSFPRFYQATETQKQQNQMRHKAQGKRELAARLRDQKMSNREVAHAIRTTRERLDILEDVLGRHKFGPSSDDNNLASSFEFSGRGK